MRIIIFSLVLAGLISCNAQDNKQTQKRVENNMYEINKTNEEWSKLLGPETYKVLRDKGTEYPGTGKYNLFFEKGEYKCAGCGNVLFKSDDKFRSECGWPSFSEVADKKAIKEIQDTSHGMIRTEVVCAKCGGHLGHVFNDGPNPTGLRYCINSVSLEFKKEEDKK